MPADRPVERPADPEALDQALEVAASQGDAAALAEGYELAAALAAAEGADPAAHFFRTHAYVWALVAGDARMAEDLAQALRRDGRLD